MGFSFILGPRFFFFFFVFKTVFAHTYAINIYNISEDIHLARATNESATEPEYYQRIFERGIDPDVDDPTQCHDHSETPDTWPELHEIVEYRGKVCKRIKALYDSGKAWSDRTVGRALWIGFEHEGMYIHSIYHQRGMEPQEKEMKKKGNRPN